MSRFCAIIVIFLALTAFIITVASGLAWGPRPVADGKCQGKCQLTRDRRSIGCPGGNQCECNSVDKSTEWPKTGTCRLKTARM
uniref:Putative evasin n=1 Tax=Rhipicephalus pulchellus TaxID=72859 RepID=L7MA33_RHIPC